MKLQAVLSNTCYGLALKSKYFYLYNFVFFTYFYYQVMYLYWDLFTAMANDVTFSSVAPLVAAKNRGYLEGSQFMRCLLLRSISSKKVQNNPTSLIHCAAIDCIRYIDDQHAISGACDKWVQNLVPSISKGVLCNK